MKPIEYQTDSPQGRCRFNAGPTVCMAVAAALAGSLVMVSGQAAAAAAQVVIVDVTSVAQGYRASKLIGTTITNDKNESIGSLDDIIIGKDKQLFAVLQVGSFLGLGGHLVA